ncbi:DUF2892 domain-containing protein [candidate division GN15 bacterium]|uniref:DUF2892 domain-containing protein n=1 Tax=candidate division GN15 bacterium TaxID=2072418 RepID=A0A855X4B1_9BACT|nr:MAG: DUF2892 domain-containing protein [candidate division GN15 bacterium]
MTPENGVRIVAGTLVLISIALSYLSSPYWLILAGFVGLNLIQSAFTHFCPAEMILRRVLAK